jgi:hypothetical protein
MRDQVIDEDDKGPVMRRAAKQMPNECRLDPASLPDAREDGRVDQ